MKTLGRPMAQTSVLEELLMEIESAGFTGIVESHELPTQVRALFVRIVKAAFFANGINNGLKTNAGAFNEHLLRLMGEENLN